MDGPTYEQLVAELGQARQRDRQNSQSGQGISHDEFNAITISDEQLAATLRQAAERQDWSTFEWLVIKADHNAQRQTIADNGGTYQKPTVAIAWVPILCQILDERHDDLNNEDIVNALELPADPRAVPTLARILHDYPLWPDGDDAGGAAVKAILGLQRIGTPEAVQALQQASTSQQLLREPMNGSVLWALQDVGFGPFPQLDT